MVGRVLAGKFRIESLLGEGGMGMVYKAIQVNLEKTIVLKVLRPSLISDDRTVQRFQREARAASRLNHPNSIAVIDFGQSQDDGSMYIAMEYCPGHDLHHILSHEWPLEESRIIRIMAQVLGALVEAHSNGVIHRDLKPENIMIEQRRGEPDFVKVLDFGIAKITDNDGDEGQPLTRAGFVCGTPEYMSPEQARGAQIDHRSDLYAIGVILYQLVTGLLPFDSESAVGFATAHLTQEVPPLRKRRPEARCSPGLDRLIMRALSKDPGQRPQTAEAFRDELLTLAPGGSASTEAGHAFTATGVTETTQVNRGAAPSWSDRTPANSEEVLTRLSEKPPPAPVVSRGRMNAARASQPPGAVQPQTTTSQAETSPERDAPASMAPRVAVGVAAVGLAAAAGFFVYEVFLKKPPAPAPDPVVAVVTPVEPVKPPPETRPEPPPKADPPRADPAVSHGSSGGAVNTDETSLTGLDRDPKLAARWFESSTQKLKAGDVDGAFAAAGMAYQYDHANLAILGRYVSLAQQVGTTNPEKRGKAIKILTEAVDRSDINEKQKGIWQRQLVKLKSEP